MSQVDPEYELEIIGNDVSLRNHSSLVSQPRAWVEDEVPLRAGRLVRFIAYISVNESMLVNAFPVQIYFQVSNNDREHEHEHDSIEL